MMSLSRPWPRWFVLSWAFLAPIAGFADDKAKAPPPEPVAVVDKDAPQGYEDAPMAEERPPAGVAPARVSNLPMAKAQANAVEEDVDPQVLQMEKQFVGEFLPALKLELLFVRRTCKMTAEDFTGVVKAARQQMNVAAREYAVAQFRLRQPRAVGEERQLPIARVLLEQHAAQAVRMQLRPEQAEPYLNECEKRTARRRRAVVLNLVVKLDEQLVLTAEQREKLAQKLSADYQDALDKWMESLLFHDIQVVPQIPDNYIVPLLTETQKAVWGKIPKNNSTTIFGLGSLQSHVGTPDPGLQEIDAILKEAELVK